MIIVWRRGMEIRNKRTSMIYRTHDLPLTSTIRQHPLIVFYLNNRRRGVLLYYYWNRVLDETRFATNSDSIVFNTRNNNNGNSRISWTKTILGEGFSPVGDKTIDILVRNFYRTIRWGDRGSYKYLLILSTLFI